MKQIQMALGHAVATAVVVASCIGFAVVAYFGVLAWAVLVGEPIVGVLALPFMMLAALVGSCIAVLTVLLPSTLLSYLICRAFKWPKLVEIPVATVVSVVISLALGAITGLFYSTVKQGVQQGLVLDLILLVPLGIYWWSLQGTSWLIQLSKCFWRRFRP